ncbi:hypothetical protein [Corynebacterium glyciniphilum]|uniref:hypothetical protein n=1 Tax=Corynebacterium glyciniphilum TaxID=1404244 RepID=UPI00265694AB|nr:hypothetical protein [Corynebacterium glyciniphilum]MDN5683336.1 hypothetical protein [Corynebacterium glyciniphilum]MDN6706496.1 hypothetical protein [Corynebacterium glyciniphilum]
MARHSAGESRVRVAGWVWIALIALILVIAVVVGWFVLAGRQDDETSAASCIDGEQRLTVWADPAAADIAQSLAERYNAEEPVVRDRCVTAVVEVTSTAEATDAYRRVDRGVAPVWIPAGTGFIPGLSGAPDTVGIVGTDDLVHYVPADGDPDPSAAVLPTGPESMVSALSAEAAGREVDADAAGAGPSLQSAREQNLPILTSADLLDGTAADTGEVHTVGEVVFPLVAFGSSPAVDEESARAAADFAAWADDPETVAPEPASPWLARTAGALAGVPLGGPDGENG